ncbi:MAG: nucleotidyltransferase family protein [Eggerthellaceae bacterium]|nr:nucleotidyltransferase family protein [Eggerthellaceae bacterium]
MGSHKLMKPLKGAKLLDYALDAACSSQADSVCVVTGFSHSHVEAAVSTCRAVPLFNPDWACGQSTSVARAAHYCLREGYHSLVVMLADQPHVDSAVIDRLVQALGSGAADAYRCIAPGYAGSPCGFTRPCFPLLTALEGDEGARQLFKAAPSMGLRTADIGFDDAALFMDIDTPEDLARLNQAKGASC